MNGMINGRAIDYEEIGRGPAVLVLHDLPSGALLREHFAPLVEAGYRVVLASLDCCKEVKRDHAGDTLALLNYLGIGRAVIIGISLGGAALLELMEKHPGRVAAGSLILDEEALLALRKQAGEGALRGVLAGGEGSRGVDLRPLSAWVERVRRRLGGRKDLGTLLAAMDLPPLMMTSNSSQEPSARPSGAQPRRFATLNRHLARLLDALVPGEEGEEVLTDRA